MKKMTIEILNDSKLVTMITENDNGTKKNKLVSMDDFIRSILASVNEKDELNTLITPLSETRREITLLQTKIINNNSKIYMLFMPKSNQPMPIYNRFYENVGIPSLLFAVKVINNRLQHLYVVATKDKKIKNSTKLYRYPFSNVSIDGLVCLGGNVFAPGIENDDYKKLYEVPYQFLSMANTGSEHAIQGYYATEELFKMFNHKEFNDDLLKESIYINYENFVKKVGVKR